MLTLHTTSQFRKDYKLAKKRNLDLSELKKVIDALQAGQTLDEKHHDHPIHGKWEGFSECHIKPDWLLIYGISDDKLVLVLARTGTHADLFDK